MGNKQKQDGKEEHTKEIKIPDLKGTRVYVEMNMNPQHPRRASLEHRG